jgi:phosphoribosylformimino-5-aminoimidazole carboxamide ribotide isomerase
MLIIPAIDILENKVVRLTKGDFNQPTFYDMPPISLSEKYDSLGFQWLHLVDLLAAKSKRITLQPLIKEIKNRTNLKIEFGGGIGNKNQVAELLNAGVDKIIIGSLSISNKIEFERILGKFNPSKFIVAIDSNNEKILTKGWTEESGISIYEHINYCTSIGVKTFLCTDVSKDGTLEGPNIQLYKKILEIYTGIKLIASGGVGSLQDIIMLKEIELYAAVIGKAIYESKIKLEDLAKIDN